MPKLIIKAIKGRAVIDTIDIPADTSARSAARTMKGLLMQMDREQFFVDDSEVEKAIPGYDDALSALVG